MIFVIYFDHQIEAIKFYENLSTYVSLKVHCLCPRLKLHHVSDDSSLQLECSWTPCATHATRLSCIVHVEKERLG